MLALKLQQLVYGAEASNADIADTLYNLGVAWTSLRGHQAAQSYLEQALQMREYIHGKDSINREIAAILNSLGLLELRNGKQQSASNYFERALEMYRKFYGANEHNIDIAVVVSNRGTILDFEYASCVYDEIYGRDGCTEERIFALSKMGLACAILYKPQEAIAYCEQAYTIIAKVNMEEVNVVNVAEALDMLGHAWSTLKKYTLALECFEKALTFKRQFYGISASNERVAKTISSIGAVSFELGEIQKALTITEQALVMYRLVQGEDADTLEIASCLVILGRCLARSEETLKAIALFLQALRIQLQYSGEANLKSLAFTLNQIGNTFLVLGGSQEALYYLQQALQAYCKLNIEHYRENIIEITDKLYGLWSAISDKQYIINYLEIARTAISKGPWDDIGFVAEAKIAMNLGCAYLEVGNNQKAAMYGEIALRLTQKVYGKQDRKDVAAILNLLGNAWTGLNSKQKAIDFYEQSLTMWRQIFGEDAISTEIATSINNLGAVWSMLGANNKALKLYESALEMKRKLYFIDNLDTAETILNIAILKRAQGNLLQALQLSKFGHEIIERFLPITHPHLMKAQYIVLTISQNIELMQSIEGLVLERNWGEVSRRYEALLLVSPYSSSYYHNYACYLHIEALEKTQNGLLEEATSLMTQAEANFKHATELEQHSNVLVEFAMFLFVTERKNEAETYLQAALNNEEDNSILMYNVPEILALISSLQTAVAKSLSLGKDQGEIIVWPAVLAYALLIQIALSIPDQTYALNTAKEYLKPMQATVTKHPSPVHYTLLADACAQLDLTEQARAYEQLADRLWAARCPVSDERKQILSNNFAPNSSALTILERTQASWRARITNNSPIALALVSSPISAPSI